MAGLCCSRVKTGNCDGSGFLRTFLEECKKFMCMIQGGDRLELCLLWKKQPPNSPSGCFPWLWTSQQEQWQLNHHFFGHKAIAVVSCAPHVQGDLSSEFWWNPNYCNSAVALLGSCKLQGWDNSDLHHNVPVVESWQTACVSWGLARSSISSKSGKTQSAHRKKPQPPELLVAFERAKFCSVPEIAHSEAHWAAFPSLEIFLKGKKCKGALGAAVLEQSSSHGREG